MIKIISFSGLDGSGKSTQVELATEYLEKQGEKVQYFHATNYSLPQQLKRLLSRKKRAGNGTEKSQAQSGTLGILLRKVVLPIDLVRFRFYRWRLQQKGYTLIISDRYYYDTLVNIAYLSKSDRFMRMPIRRPDACFYIKTSVDNIMSRQRLPDQGVNYLHAKEKLYDKLATEKQLAIIDGNADSATVSKQIKQKL